MKNITYYSVARGPKSWIACLEDEDGVRVGEVSAETRNGLRTLLVALGLTGPGF